MAKTRPLLTPTLLILLFSMVLANIGGNMYGPLLPLYVQELGANLTEVGIFFTLAMIAPLLFQILGGWFSDSIGRVQAMAIGSLAGLVGYLIFVVAPSWGWLLLAMMGLSMASSFVGPSFQALVAEQSSEETRGRVFSITQGIFMIVGIVGAPLGGFLADRFGFRPMFIVATAFYALATVIRVRMARQIRQKEEAVRKMQRPAPSLAHLKTSLQTLAAMIVSGGILTWIFISDSVNDVAFRLVENLFPIYFTDLLHLTKTELGWLGGLGSIVTMVFIFVGGWISDRFGERVGILSGSLLISLSIFLMLHAPSFSALIPIMILSGIGQGLYGPAYNALISKAVPDHLRGTAFGFFSTSLGLLSLPAPYLGTWIWQRFGPRVPFYVPAVAILALLPVIWFKFKLPQPSRNAPEGTSPVGLQASSPGQEAAHPQALSTD